MKIRADIVTVYRELHSWSGVIAGLFLFVAFYAGAISMFEPALESFLTPRVALPPAVPSGRVPELMEKAFAAFPQARQAYSIVITPDADHPARLIWPLHAARHDRGVSSVMMAALDSRGDLVTATRTSSPAARFIDTLHQRMGLPLPHEPAMIVMGFITLGYALALVSGTLIFFPALARALFAVRLVGGVRRKWLDLHNLLGFCSLPFHIIMAVTSVVFAFHDVIFTVQARFLSPAVPGIAEGSHGAGGHGARAMAGLPTGKPPLPGAHLLSPNAIVARLAQKVPGFIPDTLDYSVRQGRAARGNIPAVTLQGTMTLRVSGHDPTRIMRGPDSGFATLDPYTGEVLWRDYLPGGQPARFAALTSPFALHFGSYGGVSIRWAYLVLGFAGAFLFYTGNRLWIAVRQKRERATGRLTDTWGTWFLARLTTGWCLGAMSGIALVLIACLQWPDRMGESQVFLLYHLVFWAGIAMAFIGQCVDRWLLWFTVILHFGLAGLVVVKVEQSVSTGLGIALVAILLATLVLWFSRRKPEICSG